MRIWSLHPRYLDARGLTALWREGLLARKVLEGETRGYRHHPQLERFAAQEKPLAAIGCYLRLIYEEAAARGYRFDAGRLGKARRCARIPVTDGQLRYELDHLKRKLKARSMKRFRDLSGLRDPEPHPLFRVIRGKVERWERIKGKALQSREAPGEN
jgi:hypothetical protein